MTILRDLPIGARIRESQSGTIFIVADHMHTGWIGTTVVSEAAVKITCIDAAEPDNPDEEIQRNGNNRYSLSNLHQWLNADCNNWYKPTHEYDAPPAEAAISMRTDVFESAKYDKDALLLGPYAYDNEPGYLARFSPKFTAAIIESRIPCFGQPVDPDIIHFGPPSAEEVPCKAFILSASEIGLEDEPRWEGYLVRLFRDPRYRMCAPESAAIHREPDYIYKQSALATWVRSPLGGSSCMGKIYQAEHKFGDVVGATLMPHPVNYAAAIRPAMNLSDDVKIGKRDGSGIYELIFN